MVQVQLSSNNNVNNNAFTYRSAKKSDAGRILKFLLDYCIFEEPVIRALGSQVSEWGPIIAEMIDASLKHPFSTIVLTASNEVAGVVLNSVWSRREDRAKQCGDHDIDGYSEETRNYMEVLQKCHDDFWPLAPESVDVVIYRELSSVGKPWQRQGIATKMLQHPMLRREELSEYNIGGVVSATSSFANQQLLAKRGFRCLKEFPYADIVTSSGQKCFETDDGSRGIRINFKPLEDFEL